MSARHFKRFSFRKAFSIVRRLDGFSRLSDYECSNYSTNELVDGPTCEVKSSVYER